MDSKEKDNFPGLNNLVIILQNYVIKKSVKFLNTSLFVVEI